MGEGQENPPWEKLDHEKVLLVGEPVIDVDSFELQKNNRICCYLVSHPSASSSQDTFDICITSQIIKKRWQTVQLILANHKLNANELGCCDKGTSQQNIFKYHDLNNYY